MLNIIFVSDFLLLCTAFLCLIAASITDLRKREVPNLLSFGLIAFAFVIRAITAIIEKQPSYFIYGIIAFAIFFLLANLFYYTKIFGGGDAKLLMALSVVFATNPTFFKPLTQKFFFLEFGFTEPFLLGFLINILVIGSIYGFFYSIYLAIRNKKEFCKKFKCINKKAKLLKFFYLIVAFIFLIVVGLNFRYYLLDVGFFVMLLILLILPYLYIFVKAVEDSAMTKKIPPDKLSEGDWLAEPVKLKNKLIKPSIHGLSKREINLLK